MSDNTKIEWTTHTFNPWWGCSRVSPGCRFCYADRDASRYGHELWRRHGERRMLSDANWAKPAKWNRAAERAGEPVKVFCASMADVFEDHPQVVEPRKRLWDVVESTPWLIWQLLTKRPENVAGMAPWGSSWPGNVWLGASVEDQTRADQRIPILIDISGVAVRFLSCEPLLGPVDLLGSLDDGCDATGPAITHFGWRAETDLGPEYGCEHEVGIDWVIVGGESGPKARPMHPEWPRVIRDQCVAAGVPFLFKQWGEWAPPWTTDLPQRAAVHRFDDGHLMVRAGKRRAGRELDGRTWDEYPTVEAHR